jgi:hypothetical protein
MLPVCNNELWSVVLYCALSWVMFSLALYLPDAQKRKKEAMVGAMLIMVLVAVLALLSGYAAAQLETGLMMNMVFMIVGVAICTMAVSRVLQMLSWPRTWLAGLLGVVGYLLVGIILAWCIIQFKP